MHPHVTPSLAAQEKIEEWRDVPGYEGWYQVSSFGRVRSLDRVIRRPGSDLHVGERGHYKYKAVKGKVLHPDTKNEDGYHRFALKKNGENKLVTVHVIVALAFIGPRPEGHDTHHVDENKQNNTPSNLKYLPSGQHSSMHVAGEKCWKAKLTRVKVEEIRRLLFLEGKVPKEIAPHYGVSKSAIEAIRAGRTWK